MKTDDQGFHDDMRASQEASQARSAAIDQVGFALNDEMHRMASLQRTITSRQKLACGLIEVMSRTYPTYASEQRRMMLEKGIVAALPLIIQRDPRAQRPPALPGSEESDQRAEA